MLNKNKAQVSIFIIIGIVLVIVTSFLFFNSKFELFVPHDTKLKNQVSQIVKDCVYQFGDDGTFLLGFQGGYINIPKEIAANPFAYTDFGLKIPNWDSEVDRYPTRSFMESELNTFIRENSLDCINNDLKTLENLNIEIAENEYEIITRINNENVVIETYLPIKFNEVNSDEVLEIATYNIKMDNLRLGDLHNLALDIYNLEKQTKLFEELTIEQIMSASDYRSKESMPSEGMMFSCSKRVWSIEQLKKNLANLNNNNFKYLQIEGTYSKDYLFDLNLAEKDGYSDARSYFKKQYVYSLENPSVSYKNYDVEVVMPSTEITGKKSYIERYPYRQFEVTPSSGQIVESMDIDIDLGVDIPIPCIQVFHHLYDLDYDLIVKLTDYNEDGEKYFFQFPIRVVVENNVAKGAGSTQITKESKTFNSANYCSDESKKYPVMVVARDVISVDYLNEVNISYKCLSVKCDMGQTQKPDYAFAPGVERKYADPDFIGEFPYCVQGQVIGEKDGYHRAEVRIDTDDSLLRREAFVGDNLVELEMIPKKSFKIDEGTFLIIYKETKTGKRIYSEDEGGIYVSVENKEHKFKSSSIWPNEEGFLDKLEFLDKEGVIYNISVIYMDKDYELRGMLNYENFEPPIHDGNYLTITIPATSSSLVEDNYLEFYNYVVEKQKFDSTFGLIFS